MIRAALVIILVGIQQRGLGQNKELLEKVQARWRNQAKAGEDFTYVMYPWHNNGRNHGYGWIQPDRIYYRLGQETWRARFVVEERLSDSEAIVEVLVTKRRSLPGMRGETIRELNQFLFTGFDFSESTSSDPLDYSGGVIERPKRDVVRADGQRIALVVIEQVELPPLPKHAAEVGVGLRTWTDDTGMYTIEAAFENLSRGNVSLVNEDGKTVEVPLERLSQADREMAKELASFPRKSRRSTSRRGSGESFGDSLRRKVMGEVRKDLQRSIRSAF